MYRTLYNVHRNRVQEAKYVESGIHVVLAPAEFETQIMGVSENLSFIETHPSSHVVRQLFHPDVK